MQVKKEIISIFLEKEPVINILSSLLLNNSSFADEIQSIAENIAAQKEVTND